MTADTEFVLATLDTELVELARKHARYRRNADRVMERRGKRDIHADRLCEWVEHRIARLKRTRAIVSNLIARLEDLVEVADIAPESNCSCHIAPPCGDCVEWRELREMLAEAKACLSEARA